MAKRNSSTRGVLQRVAALRMQDLMGDAAAIQAQAELGEPFPEQRQLPKHAAAAKSRCCCYRGDSRRDRACTCVYICVCESVDRGRKIGTNFRNKHFPAYFTRRVTTSFSFTQSCCNSPSYKWVMATIPAVALYERSGIFCLCLLYLPLSNQDSIRNF